MNKFIVEGIDGSVFTGEAFKSDWKKMPGTLKIAKLTYVCGDSCIVMEGFKQYNHLLECVGLGANGITKIFLMGRTDGLTDIVVFDLKTSQIYRDQKPFGEEYGKQILDGWQEGNLDNPKIAFKKMKQ